MREIYGLCEGHSQWTGLGLAQVHALRWPSGRADLFVQLGRVRVESACDHWDRREVSSGLLLSCDHWDRREVSSGLLLSCDHWDRREGSSGLLLSCVPDDQREVSSQVCSCPWYHHSLPSSPFSSGPEGQRLPPSGTLSSEFLNQGGPARILLLVCNAAQNVRFGPPFLMREDRSISWDQLQQSVLSKLYYLMINGAQAQNARVLFNVRVVVGGASSSGPYCYLSPQDGRPLYHPAVERALRQCGSGAPPHVKLIIEWEPRVKDCLFGNIQEEVVKDAESVRGQQQQHVQQLSCSLDECFSLYTKEEQVFCHGDPPPPPGGVGL
ncbi:unnamed protein product [Boreogadus saida]